MEKKSKNQSALVQSVVQLDSFFSELTRLGAKIESMDIKNDADFELLQKLLQQFSQSGHNLSQEILILSKHLNEMRGQAESVTKMVGERAERLQSRNDNSQAKMSEFRALSEKVRDLALSINDLKASEEPGTPEERAKISARLAEFEVKLHPLIDEAKHLKKVAQDSKMKTLEQSADSLGQSLTAISQKISAYQRETQSTH
jgi:chromosome segregation ATPase